MQVKGPRGGFPTLAVMESVYHRILVAIDPEGVAEKALQHALALAHAFEAQVRLVYVIDPYGVDSARWTTPAGHEQALAEGRRKVEQMLAGSGIFWGAQDISERDVGAYTGEVSGAMIAEFGCRYVLVGHSERRTLHGETNQRVAAKFSAALRAGLVPVLCIGETLEQRDRGEMPAV